MVNPRKEPGYEPDEPKNEFQKEHDLNRRHLRNNWRNRMHSKWIRMSKGAQKFWRSMSWPHKDNWRRKNEKK